MKSKIKMINKKKILFFDKESKNQINSLNINDLLAECYANHADSILFHKENLPNDFFDLSSGVAGELMNKLSNPHMKAAVVLTKDVQLSTNFSRMMKEANKYGNFRFFNTTTEAEVWLSSE